MAKCIINDCGGISKARGLCGTCYQSAHGMVLRGSITWAELEAQGFAIPSRKPRTLLSQAITAARQAPAPPPSSVNDPEISE